MASNKDKGYDDLNALRVLKIFENIPVDDLPLLWMNATNSSPECFIVQTILVPPVNSK